MAFVRSPRGAKSRFSVAKVSHHISQLYLGAMGHHTAQWRGQIQQHAQAVHALLRHRLGEAAGVEWSRVAIGQAIEEVLRKHAPTEVHERFLMEQDRKHNRDQTPRSERWGRLEAMPETNPDRVDPAWGLVEPTAARVDPGAARASVLEGLGELARKGNRKAPPPPPPALPARRSDWVEFWRRLARGVPHPMDFEAFERLVLRLPPDVHSLDEHGWWRFWQDLLDQAMLLDPRLVGLLRVAHHRRAWARVVGQHWLAGSGLERSPTSGPLLLETPQTGSALYRSLWKEHMGRWAAQPDAHPGWARAFDLEALAQHLAPERDGALDWRGQHWMATAEALWGLPEDPWQTPGAQGRAPAVGSHELPQWAWMRTAMGLSLNEKNPTTAAKVFYDAFSTLLVLPSEAMLREAGKAQPRFLEDEAGRVHDDFESIHSAIHRAAVNTKWTGTMALDWRQVRAQGAPIAGRRYSQGPIGFMRSIHTSLAAQGRAGDDRPVTVALPLWHRDIEGFLGLRHGDGARLQTVVTVPDLFFDRLQEGQGWLLVDPAAYPEAAEGEAGYRAAEQRWRDQGGKNGPLARLVPAERLWRSLVKAMALGSPFLTFEGSDQAFAPFAFSAPPVGGIDGVGAMPVPRQGEGSPFIAWPSMAVDLSKTLDDQGQPDSKRMAHTAVLAMRALDNAIEASAWCASDTTQAYRPVCLGAVGFFEAINRGSANADNDPEMVTAWVSGLAEAWATVVLLADRRLMQERGPAPAWANAPDSMAFNPLVALDRLRQARHGGLGHRPRPRQDWSAQRTGQGHRCSVRTVWAPYQGAAKMAGVTPGGMGTLRPLDLVTDETGRARWCPTPLIMELLHQRPEEVEGLREVMRYPQAPRRWPEYVQALTFPTAEGWERRLTHAANIRPWIDQGVSLTLPAGLKPETLGPLVRRAWWLGLSNVRFDGIIPTLMTQDPSPGGTDDAASMDNPPKDG